MWTIMGMGDEFPPFQAHRQLHSTTFSGYVNELRDRRHKHMLQGNAELNSRLNQQTPLQNWIEYQAYFLLKHEAAQQEGTETEHRKRLLRWTERERKLWRG